MVLLKCSRCKRTKSAKEFHVIKNKIYASRGYHHVWCKGCFNSYVRDWRLKNRTKRLKKRLDIFKLKPWLRTFENIKSRTTKKSSDYFKRGIRCQITRDELKRLWFRDKAFLMKEPSIDRIDGNGHYTAGNCQYLELIENLSKDKRKAT